MALRLNRYWMKARAQMLSSKNESGHIWPSLAPPCGVTNGSHARGALIVRRLSCGLMLAGNLCRMELSEAIQTGRAYGITMRDTGERMDGELFASFKGLRILHLSNARRASSRPTPALMPPLPLLTI